jgi:uroporphyrinogen-III synthase
MRPRVLITRPREDAEPLARRLSALGAEPVIEPLIAIHRETDAPLDLADAAAVALTSANGARTLAAVSFRRDVPVFAVGEATAAAARDAGFGDVRSAAGDVNALATLIMNTLAPAAGWVVHVSGADAAGDLAGRLQEAGFRARRVVLYRAMASERLSEATRTLLRSGSLAMVLFFSPRTATTFVRLANRDELGPACRSAAAVCLSGAVADAVRVLPWREVRVARVPDQDSLLDEVARLMKDAAAIADVADSVAKPEKGDRP